MIMGIDTSCYTTSLAIVDENGKMEADRRLILNVKPGEKGLRQSEAVFQHLENMPRLFATGDGSVLTGISVSARPRPVTGSYLPVFKAGIAFGESIAKLLKIPIFTTSHQEGHVRSGIIGHSELQTTTFLTWHLSGGTTELLLSHPNETGFTLEKVGGTSDLQVGQFVDRVGVALGTGFPAGPALERLAEKGTAGEINLPVAVQGLEFSISGPASAAERIMGQSAFSEVSLARAVFDCIAKSIYKTTLHAVEKYNTRLVLLVGGVASNRIIRETLETAGKKAEIRFFFASRELSSDNAVGVALLGYDYFSSKGMGTWRKN